MPLFEHFFFGPCVKDGRYTRSTFGGGLATDDRDRFFPGKPFASASAHVFTLFQTSDAISQAGRLSGGFVGLGFRFTSLAFAATSLCPAL
jgi:hypothetical protein